MLYHRLEHMCGDDDVLAMLATEVDDMFLVLWDFFYRDLDTEVPSRHHHSSRELDDRLEIFDSFGILYLRDNLDMCSTVGVEELSYLTDIVRSADE